MSFWVAGAVLGAGTIGAIGSNLAAGTQAGAQTQAAQTQQNMFNTINQQQQPFIQGGYSALNDLLYRLGIGGSSGGGGTGGGGTGGYMPTPGGGVQQILTNAPAGARPAGSPGGPGGGYGSLTGSFTPQDFLANLDPGFQFQLQTGGQAIRNADTPGVGALSGPALKDLMSFNQGMAATGYQNAYNRWQTTNQNIFSRLSGIAGLGQNAAANVGTSGTQLGTGIAQAQAAAGGSLAGGIVGSANAIGSSGVPLAYLLSGQGGGNTPSYNSAAADLPTSAFAGGGT